MMAWLGYPFFWATISLALFGAACVVHIIDQRREARAELIPVSPAPLIPRQGTVYSSMNATWARPVVDLVLKDRTTLGFRPFDKDMFRRSIELARMIGRRDREPLEDREPVVSRDLDIDHGDSCRVMPFTRMESQRNEGSIEF